VVGLGLRSECRTDRATTAPMHADSFARTLYFEQAKEHVDIKSPPHRAAAPRELHKSGVAPLIVFKHGKLDARRPSTESLTVRKDSRLDFTYAGGERTIKVPVIVEEMSAQRSELTRQLETLRSEQMKLERGTGSHKIKRRHIPTIAAKPAPASLYKEARKLEEMMRRTSKLVAQETMHPDDDDNLCCVSVDTTNALRVGMTAVNSAKSHRSPGFEFLPLYERKPLVPMVDDAEEDALAGVAPPRRNTMAVTAALDERFLGQLFPVHVPASMHASEAVTAPESPIRNLRPSTCVCTRSSSTRIPECTCQCFDWKLRPLPVLVDEDPALVFAVSCVELTQSRPYCAHLNH
jgi:hypothetical protein